jgi:hypothetical protein
MTYTEEKKSKISKYCYRMGKACGQRDMGKVSEYFSHLKHHVMIGGATNELVTNKISEIEKIVKEIESGVQPILDRNRLNQENISKIIKDNEAANAEIIEKNLKISQLDEQIKKDTEALKQANEQAQLVLKGEHNEAQNKLNEEKNKLDAELKKNIEQKNLLENSVLELIGDINNGKFDTTFTNIENQIKENEEAKKYLTSIKDAIQLQIKHFSETGASKLSEKDSQLGQLQNMNNTLKAQIDQVETTNKELLAKLAELEKTNVDLKKTGDDFNDKLLENLSNIEIILKSIQANMGNVVGEMSKGSFDELAKKYAEAKAKVDDLNKKVNELTKVVQVESDKTKKEQEQQKLNEYINAAKIADEAAEKLEKEMKAAGKVINSF